MSRPLIKATIRSSGEKIEVYRSVGSADTWINFEDCTTTYTSSELILPKKEKK